MRVAGRRSGRLLLICIVLLIASTSSTVPISYAESNCQPDGIQASGAVYRICLPAEDKWNGDLVVYAHGYVAFNEPIAIPEDHLILPDDIYVPQLANDLGFAFATTSYSTNGLAVRQGLADVVDLVDIFSATFGQPDHVYLVGPSEGGIITALAIEQYPNVFDGGLSTCGPVGNFRWQLNYWGDVRVLFDYFFPGVLPGSPVEIPQEVIDNWDTLYEAQVEAALSSSPAKMKQLLHVARIPAHPTDDDENLRAILDVLWYNVFATNDGVAKLGGQPFDNKLRYYHGSDNDLLLNLQVARFQADPAAIEEVGSYYQTSGDIGNPLVTLHTLGDPIIPYWHEPVYKFRINFKDNKTLHTNIPILLRYGHCNFSTAQALLGFVLLVHKATGQLLPNAEQVLLTTEEREAYRDMAAAYGILDDESHWIYLPIIVH